MKELHNNIFSNTTCISKETMLKYINKQLDKTELHQVEKHLLDCELCTDAMEGMKYARNSSVLFTINHKINQRIKTRGAKFSILNNLMIAASIILIVFGSYFMFNFFNTDLKNEHNLAMNNAIPKIGKPLPKENFILPAKDTIKQQFVTKNVAAKQPSTPAISNKNSIPKGKKVKPLTPPVQAITSTNNAPADMKAAVAEQVFSTETAKEEEATLTDEVSKTNVANNTLSEDNRTRTLNNVAANTQLEIATKSKEKVKQDNDARLSTIATDRANKFHQIDYIETYKIVDYTVQYQNDEEFKKQAEPASISPDFATKAEQDLADKEMNQSTIKITYKQTLKAGIHQFKLTHYKIALVQFNLILTKHPKDVNALFYAGLSYYNLKNYTKALGLLNKVLTNKEMVFAQEATWYKSLTFIELKENKKAKKLLKQIINEAGFYKNKAAKKLKML